LTIPSLLDYPLHTILDWMDERYRKVRARLPSRWTFFEHLRILLLYLPFVSWGVLMTFMLDKLRSRTPDWADPITVKTENLSSTVSLLTYDRKVAHCRLKWRRSPPAGMAEDQNIEDVREREHRTASNTALSAVSC
jgi:hypothetical protein